jgi:purine-binding chemotaxis protein CheW
MPATVRASLALFRAAAVWPGIDAVAHWVVFCLDDGRYALPLSNTVRIVRAAEITPLPAAPPNVLGALNVAGNVLPVFNLRRRFGLPERALAPADHLLIARTGDRTVVLTIDAAVGVIDHPETEMVDAARITSDLAHIRGVLPLEDGLVLIHDLGQFLSSSESRQLEDAMDAEARRAG